MERDPLALDDCCFLENNKLLVPKNENILHNVEPIPIVYTTKLDDMSVFKMDIDSLNADTVLDYIIKESKPKLRRLNKIYPQRKSATSFRNVEQTLYKINNKAQENYKTLHNYMSSDKSIQIKTNISEKAHLVSNSQVNTGTTDGEIKCKTETAVVFYQVSNCELMTIKKQCISLSNPTIEHKIVEPREEIRPQLETETTADKDIICTKLEPLEVSKPDSDCEILETNECNPKSMRAIKRKIVDRQECIPMSTTEVTPDPDIVICTKEGPLKVCNLKSKREPIKKRKKCTSKSSIAIKCKVGSTQQYNCQLKSDIPAANDFMSERQKELMKLCRPLSIVLEDIGDSTLENYKSNDTTIKTYKVSGTDVTLKNKTEPRPFVSFDSCKKLNRKFLLCYDEFSSELDMYYVDGNGDVRDYYKLKGEQSILNRAALLPYIGDEDVVLLLCCCWYQRDRTVKTMWHRLISFSATKFIRKPHNCVPGDCICCCQYQSKEASNLSLQIIKSTDHNSKINEDIENFSSAITHYKINETLSSIKDYSASAADNEIQDLVNEISSVIKHTQESFDNQVTVKHKNVWHQQLLTNNSDSHNLINVALSYTKQIPKLPNNNDEASKKLCMENPTGSCFARVVANKNAMEWFEFTRNGEVLAYTTRNTNPHTMKSSDVCCWIRREHFFSKLDLDQTEMGQRKLCPAIKFMGIPHLCPAGNCRCCCKSTKKIDDNGTIKQLLDITLPTSINSATMKQTNSYNFTRPINILPKPVTGTPGDQDVLVKPKNSYNSLQPINILPKPVIGTPGDQGVVDSLITTILDTFKDVRLTITEDGKVAAALKTPIDTLSTAELKVLSKILSHAQEQVKALGLSPGTYSNNHIMNASSQTLKILTQDAINTAAPVIPNNMGIYHTPIPSNFNSSAQLNTHSDLKSNGVDKNINQGFSTTQIKTNPSMKPVYLPNKPQNYFKPFTETYSDKSEYYVKSFKSHLNRSVDSQGCLEPSFKPHVNVFEEPTETSIPRIANVFSLQNDNSNLSNESGSSLSALKAISDEDYEIQNNIYAQHRTPNNTEPMSKFDDNGVGAKGKSVQKETSSQTKIRVVSPSKLGVTNNPPNRNILNELLNNSIQLQTMKSIESVIPGHIVAKGLAVGEDTNQSSIVIEVCGDSIQLIPDQSQANSNINVNSQLSHNSYGNNFHMVPLANNLKLLKHTHINEGDILLVNKSNEIDLEELDIPEFRINKPTRSMKPMQRVSKPNQPQVNDANFLSNVSRMSAENAQTLQESGLLPIAQVGVTSGNNILTPLFNATPQHFINDTIGQVFKSLDVSSTKLQELLLAPRKPIRPEESAPVTVCETATSLVTPLMKYAGPSGSIQNWNYVNVTEAYNSPSMASNAAETEEGNGNIVLQTDLDADIKHEDDLYIKEGNISDADSDSKLKLGPDDNENESVCILGV